MKSVKINYFYNVLVNLTAVIFPIITAPYVARVLEPDGIGLFNFSATYAGYFALFALLGIPTYGVREIAKIGEDKIKQTKLVSELMSIAVITTTLVSFIYLVTIALVGQLSENYLIFILAGFVIYLAPFKINWYYQGVEEFGYITFITLLVRVFSIVCLFLFVHDKTDLIAYVFLNVLGGVIADVWNFVKLVRSGVRPYFTLINLRRHLKPLLLLFASSVAISIYTVLDTIMLGFIKDYTEVGYYYNASHITKIILSFATSLSIVVIPRFSSYIGQKDMGNAMSLFNKSVSFTSFLVFPMAIGLMLISPVFIPWFFGNLFYGSIIPMMILSFLIIAIGFSSILGMQVLVGLGQEKLFLYSILIGAVLNFILNSLLISPFGAVGASIASVVAEVTIVVVMAWFIYKFTPIRINIWNNIFKSLLGSLLFIPTYFALKSITSEVMFLTAFILICAFLYLVTQRILKNDMLSLMLETIKNIQNKVYFNKNKQ